MFGEKKKRKKSIYIYLFIYLGVGKVKENLRNYIYIKSILYFRDFDLPFTVLLRLRLPFK